MESWGCEFLDYQNIHNIETKDKKIYQLPMHLIEQMVNPENAKKIILNDIEYVNHLRYLINTNGLEYPGLVIVASNGVLLQDGNHRFFAMKDTYEYFPVEIRFSNNPLRVKGGSYLNIMKDILELL